MKIAHIKINSILGIDELEFSPEGYNEISGQNGKGKTSVLEAIKAATGGGHDATLLRKGADKGEIVLVLDDGTEIKKRVTAARSTTDVTGPDGKKVGRPTDALKGLTDLLSVNPVEFLTARKQDRVKVLLESMPIELDVPRLQELAGIPVTAGPGVHALSVIETVRKEVYDLRTGTNRAVKEKDATINQLRLAMPDVPGGVEGDETALQGQIDTARETRDAELQRITTKIDGIRTDHQKKIDTLKAEAQAKIDAIRTECETAVDAVKSTLAGIESKANVQRDLTKNRFTEATTPIQASLVAVRTNRDAAAKRAQTQATIAQMETDLEELTSDAEKQTAAIEAIDQYKSDLLADLPIPGVEVVDGEVFRGGIPFDRLNTAQQVDIAVEIAKLRAGSLAVCCLDGFELLDPEALEEFKRRAEESNVQFFVTRVTGEEFTVRTE